MSALQLFITKSNILCAICVFSVSLRLSKGHPNMLLSNMHWRLLHEVMESVGVSQLLETSGLKSSNFWGCEGHCSLWFDASSSFDAPFLGSNCRMSFGCLVRIRFYFLNVQFCILFLMPTKKNKNHLLGVWTILLAFNTT